MSRKAVFGGKPLNFYPGSTLREEMKLLELRRKKMKLPYAFTCSFILREGAWMFIQQMKHLMKKAESGNLHAKRRASYLLGVFETTNNKTKGTSK